MKKTTLKVGLVLLACGLGVATWAHDGVPPAIKLAFDDAPASWKARPPEAKRYLCDYDLPDGARVNVYRFPMTPDELRGKLVHRWTSKDGAALEATKLPVEKKDVRGVALTTLVLDGTYTPKDGAAKPDWQLVATHLDAPGGAWSAWLIGPKKAVEEQRASYTKWLESVRAVTVDESAMVRETRFVHGAPAHGVPGPWALTAYRIGHDALSRFKIDRDKAWEITVTHRSPRKVQYTCMLDGLVASTGASPGKMNLLHEEVASEDLLETVVLHKPSKRTLTYRLTKEHRERIRPVDYAGFPDAAKDLEQRKPEEVFTVEEK